MMTAKEFRISLGGKKIILKWTVVMVAQLFKYTKNHSIVHFK